MSTFIASTSKGIFPAACTASVWNSTPRSRAIRPISAIGCTTPISLFAAITLITVVFGVIASRSRSRSIRPSRPTGR